jgi:signal transduction histidine kinase
LKSQNRPQLKLIKAIPEAANFVLYQTEIYEVIRKLAVGGEFRLQDKCRASRQAGKRIALCAVSCAALTAALTTPSSAASLAIETTGLISSVGLLFVGVALAASLYRIRKLARSELNARRKLADIEHQLNEAEAAIQSEAQVLLTWRGRDSAPDKMVGNMHGLVKMPAKLTDVMEFDSWLDADSAVLLQQGLQALRTGGQPFNFSVRNKQSDLIEADGRTAGGLATLRFRPLAGDRRQTSETLYDAHKLAKQVERLSAVLDSAPFPIWIKKKDGGLSWANSAYVKSTEQPDIDTVIRNNAILVKAENIDATRADQATHMIGRAHAIQLGTMHAFNIHEIDLNVGRAGYAIDVTPLEAAEKELDRHIKAHASTLDKLNTAIAIFGADQRLRFFNQAYLALWGFDEDWLQSHPSDGQILDKLRADRKLPEEANYREWRSKQLAAYTNLEIRETYWYLPDGRSLRVICEQHPFGGVTYLYENLTKEYQLESRYNELFEVQRETLDNLAEAVALSGSDGRLKLFNPAFQKFWSLDDGFLNQKPHVEQLAQLPSLSVDSRAGWQDIKFGVTGIEANRRAHEGQMDQDGRILRYRAVPLPDGNALLTFTDVSDAARAEQALRDRTEALEAADRLKNSILANVSYEVRTPLTSIVGFAETLEYGLAGPLTDKQREYVGDIRKSSEDLKTIIDAIIDLSAIDAGQMELKLASFDVAQLLTHAAEKFNTTLKRRELNISIEMASDVDTIFADENRLDQILTQLLSNAAGFSQPGGTIRMGARKLGESLQLWVADNGHGIEPEFQDKVFERFQAKPRPGSHRGAGLGLALVKSFTELHGGKVSLVSKIQQGTTVVCTLPLDGPRKKDRTLSLAQKRNAAA